MLLRLLLSLLCSRSRRHRKFSRRRSTPETQTRSIGKFVAFTRVGRLSRHLGSRSAAFPVSNLHIFIFHQELCLSAPPHYFYFCRRGRGSLFESLLSWAWQRALSLLLSTRWRGANCKEPILIERRAIEAPWKIHQYGTRNWKGKRKWGLISRSPRGSWKKIRGVLASVGKWRAHNLICD